MARIHILSGGTNNTYQVVVHAPAPAGNNGAGVPWADAIKNSGRAITIMPIGNGAGQISQSESNSIAAGTVIEGTFVWGDDPSWTMQQRTTDLNLRASQLVAELLDQYQRELRFFGQTVA